MATFQPIGPPKAPKKMEIRPKPMRTVSRIPTGPRMYRKLDDPQIEGGPGEPPPGFVTPTTSKTEWVAFWATWKATNAPGDPRKGPWTGPPTGEFAYQSWELGGRKQLGGAVVDLVIYTQDIPIGCRIVTEYFHIFAGAQKAAMDLTQAIELGRSMTVVDVYDYEFLPLDAQGLVIYFKQAYGMIKSNPISSATARRNRA